jgi:hypothetical protein
LRRFWQTGDFGIVIVDAYGFPFRVSRLTVQAIAIAILSKVSINNLPRGVTIASIRWKIKTTAIKRLSQILEGDIPTTNTAIIRNLTRYQTRIHIIANAIVVNICRACTATYTG